MQYFHQLRSINNTKIFPLRPHSSKPFIKKACNATQELLVAALCQTKLLHYSSTRAAVHKMLRITPDALRKPQLTPGCWTAHLQAKTKKKTNLPKAWKKSNRQSLEGRNGAAHQGWAEQDRQGQLIPSRRTPSFHSPHYSPLPFNSRHWEALQRRPKHLCICNRDEGRLQHSVLLGSLLANKPS